MSRAPRPIRRLRRLAALFLLAAPLPVAAAAADTPPAAAVGGPPAALLTLPADRPLRAGFLVVDGVYDTELMAPLDVLQHTRSHVRPGIEVFTVSPDGSPVRTFEGLLISPDYGFASAPAVDILVVPSAAHSMDSDLDDRRLVDWVRTTASNARFVVSLCDGAFVLAEAGLLDHRAATTFPDDYRRFADRFPHVDLRVNVSFVQDGRLLTSEGGARSYDAALYLVSLLYGEEIAREVGHGVLVPWPPEPPIRYISDPRFHAAPISPAGEDPSRPFSR